MVSNLPLELTSFIGRERETDPALVPSAVLEALRLREEASRPISDTLIDHLVPRTSLLVMDNCERLLDAVAVLAESLLRVCPGLRILATSRQPLGIGGETVRLFVDRATTAHPGFSLTDENARAVAEICRRLDGIPLAIELAVARIKALTAAQIAARLDDRFHLLTTGSRTALPRQQTLRGTIDWSYDLLSERERMLLRRMAVFVGGWTLEAAEEAVGGNDERAGLGETVPRDDVLDLITGLIEKSLVLSEEEDGVAQYHLLETVRQYALERLEASGEERCARAAHAERYLTLAEAASAQARGDVPSNGRDVMAGGKTDGEINCHIHR